jgi:hypothetical protein
MCPVCMANAALMAASVASTGGLSVFAVTKLFRANEVGREDPNQPNARRIDNDKN